MSVLYDDEFTFIGFDCGYRSLGWTILGYNPHADDLRKVYVFRAGGVVDTIGRCIADTSLRERADALARVLDLISSLTDVTRSIVIIEKQPHGHGKGVNNYVIESQIIYHFSRVARASCVHIIHAKYKNMIAERLLRENRATSYAERKKQSRRAFSSMAEHFDFDACTYARDIRRVRADLADSCMQIIAAIVLHADNIDAERNT